MTSKNTKHVKASVSKWSRHNEYSHAARSNNFWPENMVTLSQQLSSGPSSADHVGLWPLPAWLAQLVYLAAAHALLCAKKPKFNFCQKLIGFAFYTVVQYM